MSEITLIRAAASSNGNFGILAMDGIPLCVTLERPWLNNQHDISCIPIGIYGFTKYLSPTKGFVWITQEVPDRQDIEIHAANLPSQLKGCIAVGQYFYNFDGIYGVANSQATLEMLRTKLPDSFDLTIN